LRLNWLHFLCPLCEIFSITFFYCFQDWPRLKIIAVIQFAFSYGQFKKVMSNFFHNMLLCCAFQKWNCFENIFFFLLKHFLIKIGCTFLKMSEKSLKKFSKCQRSNYKRWVYELFSNRPWSMLSRIFFGNFKLGRFTTK